MIGVVLTNRTAADRSAVDFYATPDNVTEALLLFLGLPQSTVIWECAAGQGHMARVLERHGHSVIATDLETDFLTCSPRGDMMVTNPPFSLAGEFIKRAIQNHMPFALLLKSQYWHAEKRRALFFKHRPQYVLPLTWRPDFHFGKKGGAPTMECLWTVWGAEPATVTQYLPLAKPGRKEKV